MDITPDAQPQPLKEEIGTLWRNVAYRRVAIFTLIAWGGVGISQAFRPLYITELGFSARFAALVTTPVVLGAYGLASQGWGRLADKYGSKGVYALAGAGVVVAHLLLALPTDNGVLSGAFFAAGLALSGAAWGGFDSANLRRLFNVVPQKRQSMYLAAYSLVACIMSSLGSFLGGLLLGLLRSLIRISEGAAGFERALDYRLLFLTTAVLIAAAVAYSRRMQALQETDAGRLLLYLRIRTQRYVMSGIPGDVLRLIFPEQEREEQKKGED